MTLNQFLQQLETVVFPFDTLPVYETIRAEIQTHFSISPDAIDWQQWAVGPKPTLLTPDSKSSSFSE